MVDFREANGALAHIQGLPERLFVFASFYLEWLLKHPNCHMMWVRISIFASWVSILRWQVDFLVHDDLGDIDIKIVLLIPLDGT